MDLRFEPAAVVAAVEAALVAAIAFGLDVTPEQLAAIVAALSTFGALFVRSRTTTHAFQEDVDH